MKSTKKMNAHQKMLSTANSTPTRRRVAKLIATLKTRLSNAEIREALDVKPSFLNYLAKGVFEGTEQFRAKLEKLVAKTEGKVKTNGRGSKTGAKPKAAKTSKPKAANVDVETSDDAADATETIAQNIEKQVEAFRRQLQAHAATQLDLFGARVLSLNQPKAKAAPVAKAGKAKRA